MKIHRILLFVSLPLTITLTFGVLMVLPPRPGITKSNFDRIKMAMTKAQVEEIFGRTGERSLCANGKGIGFVWIANDGAATIEFAVGDP